MGQPRAEFSEQATGRLLSRISQNRRRLNQARAQLTVMSEGIQKAHEGLQKRQDKEHRDSIKVKSAMNSAALSMEQAANAIIRLTEEVKDLRRQLASTTGVHQC